MKFAMFMALLFTGCATQPSLQAPTEPVATYNSIVFDESCANLAKYARAVSIMRDVGVKVEDVDFILPKTPNIPTGAMKRLVYSRGETDPTITTTTVYGDCVAAGYEPTIERLRIEETAYNFQEKMAIQKKLADSGKSKLRMDQNPGAVKKKPKKKVVTK